MYTKHLNFINGLFCLLGSKGPAGEQVISIKVIVSTIG